MNILMLLLLLTFPALSQEGVWEAKAVDSKGAYGVGTSSDKDISVELAIEACEDYTEEVCVIVYVVWKL